jgi:hypothetical protein
VGYAEETETHNILWLLERSGVNKENTRDIDVAVLSETNKMEKGMSTERISSISGEINKEKRANARSLNRNK